MIDIYINYLKTIDKQMGTTFEYSYKKIMWNCLNEFEKPLMKSVFINGRQWRKFKDKFLTVNR